VNEQTSTIPEGYVRNASGHLVPEAQVRDQDKLRDQVARDLATEALELSGKLAAFRKKALSDIADLVSIAAAKYDVQLGGTKGNVTVSTYDGRFKVTRTYAERVTFTEELEAAKELINDCIMRWSEGANVNIRALVDRAFRTDSKGQIKTTAVLELLRLEIDDAGWQRAMAALKDSIQSAGTSVYIRVYQRIGNSDQYQAVPLDLAAV
jgi:hypothetical protein|tara:strand:- start:309 stop:932 length:624 start_codon:yes stop_codon:yes gene_type:complete